MPGTNEQDRIDENDLAKTIAAALTEESEPEEISTTTNSEIEQQVIDRDSKDLFEDCVNPRVQAGEVVKLWIDKDHERVGTVKANKVRSWDDAHRLFAHEGGQLKIQARSAKGTYIAQAVKDFAPYISDEDDDVEEKPNSTNELTDLLKYMTQKDHQTQETMQNFMDRLEKKQESQKSQSSELIKTLTVAFAPLIVKMVQPKEDNSSMDMMKLIMDQRSKDQENQIRMMEKFEDKVEKIIDKVTTKPEPPKDDFNALGVMKMIEEAKKSAKDETMTMFEFIEAKAAEQAANKGESDPNESITDKALKALLPALPALMQAGAALKGQPSVDPRLIQNNRQRRPLRQPTTQHQKRNPAAQDTTEQAAQRRNPESSIVKSRQINRQIDPLKDKDVVDEYIYDETHEAEIPLEEVDYSEHGLPTAPETTVETVEVEATPESDIIEEELPELNEDEIKALKEQLVNICGETILLAMASEGGSEDCAAECLGKIEEAEIEVDYVQDAFKIEDIISAAEPVLAISDKTGRREEATQWLRNFYETLLQLCSE